MNKAMWQEEAETKLLHGWLSLSPSTSWLYLQQPKTQPGGRRRENSQSGQTGSWDRQQRPCFLNNSVAGMASITLDFSKPSLCPRPLKPKK